VRNELRKRSTRLNKGKGNGKHKHKRTRRHWAVKNKKIKK
jgi:hypothetical protein